MLTKAAIQKAKPVRTKKVKVPEWGGEVYVLAMSGTERDAYEAEYMAMPEKARAVNMRARMAARVIVNDKGDRLFTDDDINWLGDQPASALERIFIVAMKLAGMTKDDAEELEKNSPSAPSGASTSGSPSPSDAP